MVQIASRTYRELMAEASEKRTLELWYDRIHIDQVIDHFPARYRARVERDVRKARRKDHTRAVARLTRSVDGRLRFVEDPPLLVHLERTDASRQDIEPMLESYRQSLSDERRDLLDRFRLVDVARKVVGVGSVGTRCWVALFEGPDRPGGDHLVLQVKEAQPSVLEPYAGPPASGHDGRRVVVGQRLTQAASDLFLGWCEGPRTGRHYYVRQLWDVKGQSDVTRMDLSNLEHYGALCAWALARAHARTGDPVELAGYLGRSSRFDVAIAEFAAGYAAQNARDHRALLEAVASGRVRAATRF